MASAAKAIAEAGINVPAQPPECWRDISHAPLVDGEERLTLASREAYQLNQANAQGRYCAAYNENLRSGATK
ncbi:MAG: hypothetical protein KKB37_11440 [Alphaproteobacteria bacterium]|nr:hypothetical protein [Alphaproteobacteria bacterium]